jgi:hypothetical protein
VDVLLGFERRDVGIDVEGHGSSPSVEVGSLGATYFGLRCPALDLNGKRSRPLNEKDPGDATYTTSH